MIECGSRVVVKGKGRKKKEGGQKISGLGINANATPMRSICALDVDPSGLRIPDPGPGGVGCVELLLFSYLYGIAARATCPR